MSDWIPLNCPACGGTLSVASDAKQFTCTHCNNAFLLKDRAMDLKPLDRQKPSPLITYTHQHQQWLAAGDYEVFVHEMFEEKVKEQRVFYANVEYRNPGSDILSCRHNQWVIFDRDGYGYDSSWDSNLFKEHVPGLTGERFASPGMQVRAWVAFKVPSEVEIIRLQFITAFLSTRTIEFILAA